MNYNELAITARIQKIHPEAQFDGKNGKPIRRIAIDFEVPTERPNSGTGETSGNYYAAQMQLLNGAIDTFRAQNLAVGDWAIVEFRLSGRESQGKIFNNLNIIKLSKTKP